MDGINPRALTTLVFLISYLSLRERRAGRSGGVRRPGLFPRGLPREAHSPAQAGPATAG